MYRAAVEERHDLAGLGINARKIRPFVGVAAVAGESEILRVVAAPVLFRSHVLDVEGDEGSRFLRNAAILAHVTGAPPDEFTCLRIHPTRRSW